jgi:transcriptional regulator with XRE-family HTH domain
MGGIVGLDVLGQRIRDLRLARHLTLKQVEEASGLSATHLSEIERGRTSPTVGALTRIARALGRDAAYFVETEDLADVGHLPRGRREGYATAGGARVERLTPGIPGSLLAAYHVSLRPGPAAAVRIPASGAHGEAVYLVREGRVEASFGTARYDLGARDGAHARLAEAHTLRATDGQGAEVIALLRGTRACPEEPAGLAGEPAAGVAGEPGLCPREPSADELGRRIKALRVGRGLTLKELESRGGISATHVSEIERGRASPTVGALGRIARALGLPPAALVEPRVLPEVAVLRAEARAALRLGMGRAHVEPVAGPVHEAALSARLVHLPPGPEPVRGHRHEGEEWATVLSGRAEARVDEATYRLDEGDAIHFRAWREHGFVNLAAAPTVLLVAHRPRPTL